MGLLIKMETQVEVQASAERIYHVFSAQPHHLPNICSDVDDVNILDGEWHTHGSSRSWEYKHGGKVEKVKEKVELDEENKTVTRIGLEGDVFNHYKTFQLTWQAIPKPGEEGAILKMGIAYEKLSKDYPSPDNYLELMVNVAKEVDAHLSNT